MASGYDINNQSSFKLMKGRLGVYEKLSSEQAPELNEIDNQKDRLQQHGGNIQQERMIRDKRRSLDRATQYSYQAAKVLSIDKNQIANALINPNKLKPDYDDKIISIGYEYDFQVGTVFEWQGTNTYWIVYLQDLTELAYFRGDIRKCTYQIQWEDNDGFHSTYAAVRGPVETKINFIQKHGISVDSPNHSLSILLPHTKEAYDYFKRYGKFYLQGDSTCWRVEATDWLSTPGILEITAVEYFANDHEDDVENGVVGGRLEQLENNINETETNIIGDTFIKIKKFYDFVFNGEEELQWSVSNKNLPVELITDSLNPKKVSIKWNSPQSGQFELLYGDYKKTIVVESLF